MIGRKKRQPETRSIQVGATDGCRYVGIQPHISPEEAARLKFAAQNYLGTHALITTCEVDTSDTGEPYTMMGIATDNNTLAMAVALVVQQEMGPNSPAVLNTQIQPIGSGARLFSGRA